MSKKISREIFEKAVEQTKIFCAEKMGIIPEIEFKLYSPDVDPEGYEKLYKHFSKTKADWPTTDHMLMEHRCFASFLEEKKGKKYGYVAVPTSTYEIMTGKDYYREAFFLCVAHEVAGISAADYNSRLLGSPFLMILADSAVFYFSRQKEKYRKAYEEHIRKDILVKRDIALEVYNAKRVGLLVFANREVVDVVDIDFRQSLGELRIAFGSLFPLVKDSFKKYLKGDPYFNSIIFTEKSYEVLGDRYFDMLPVLAKLEKYTKQ